MATVKKVKDYNIKVHNGWVLSIVKPDNKEGYPFQYDYQQKEFVKVNNLTFNELRDGIYSGRVEIY